jgi:hypothetical protein
MRVNAVAVITLVLVALAGSGMAQSGGALTASAPPAEIISFEWKYQGYASRETVRDETSTLSMKSKREVIYVFKYTTKMSLKNLGAKTIKAVEWNYVFIDPDSRKELKRYKLLSKQQILPSETRSLAKDIFFGLKEDTRHLNTGAQKILLTRIEYTDGTSWRP